MNGTVLNVVDGAGILLDDQGNRYSFGQGEVKSGIIRNGSKVNFVVEGNQAKEIYIMVGGDPLGSLSQSVTDLTGGSEVKTGAYIAAAGAFLSLLGVFSALLAFVGFGLELYGVYRLASYKGEMSFFTYRVKAIVSGFIAILLTSSAIESFGWYGLSFGHSAGSGVFAVVKALLGVAAAVYAVRTMFKALKGIADAYNAPLFNLAAWLYLVALISPIIFLLLQSFSLALTVPSYLMGVYSILLVIAYITIQDVAKVDRPTTTNTQPKTTPVFASEPVKKEETVTCPQCQSENLLTAKFCTNCGGSLVKEVVVEEIVEPKCSVCGKVYTDGSKFCEEDGGKIV